MQPLDHATLGEHLRQAVADALREAPPFDPFPSVELAVVAFPPDAPPVWADVLFQRDFPQGLAVDIPDDAGPSLNLRWFADRTDAAHESVAWQPGADWTRIPALDPLWGDGPFHAIAPYPASLIKLMVAVGCAWLVERGDIAWTTPWPFEGQTRTVAAWAEPMIAVSDNDATRALVALLHAQGLIAPGRNGLNELFERWRLPTLRLDRTRPDGGWFNRDGAGVGALQMTAWDSVRLLWLLTPDAPPPPWLPAPADRSPAAPPGMAAATLAPLWRWLDDQALHEVLSSTLLAGLPGWRPGLPARLPPRWMRTDGSADVAGRVHPPDIRPADRAATRRFAHKTGTTDNYLADAGIVRSLDGRLRYGIALISTLGRRHAAHPLAAAPWCIPAIGGSVDAWLARNGLD